MGMFDDTEGIVTRYAPVIFVIGTSKSMTGTKISVVNDSIRDLLPSLSEMNSCDIDFKLAILQFDSEPKWMYRKLLSPEEFIYQELVCGDDNNFGKALDELDYMLRKITGKYKPMTSPLFLLFCDRNSTDNYKNSLENLKNNDCFKYAMKFAIAIGEDVDMAMLVDFTGNKECILKDSNSSSILKLIEHSLIPMS